MIDLDHFKQINDSKGHTAGDQVLKTIGMVIESQLRDQQRGGRWGGDEFLVILPQVNESLAQQVAARLHTKIQLADGPAISIGVATRRPGEDIHRVVHRADKALYQAKNEGRNQVRSAPQDTPVRE